MSTQPKHASLEDHFFQQGLPQVYRAILRQFRRITTAFVLFNVLFISAIAAELLFFLLFLPVLIQSTFFAIALSSLFLTIFSYLVLFFYYQAKKPEQLVSLRDQFLSSLRQLLSSSKGEAQHHLSIAAALINLSSYLEEFECQLYSTPRALQPLKRPLSALSAACHWQDVFRFKQLLLHAAIDEHLFQIRSCPTDLELHASLANTYISLSLLFKDSKQPKKKELFEKQFSIASRLAIEEFQILNHYAPNDPWVHERLASGYRDLQMPQEEIKEIEFLLHLRPQDRDLLYRLGALYFEQGWNAKGLQIFEELKLAHYKKAEDLLATYGKRRDSHLLFE